MPHLVNSSEKITRLESGDTIVLRVKSKGERPRKKPVSTISILRSERRDALYFEPPRDDQMALVGVDENLFRNLIPFIMAITGLNLVRKKKRSEGCWEFEFESSIRE